MYWKHILNISNPTKPVSKVNQRRRKSGEKKSKASVVVKDEFICKEETHLTVLKTSLFFANDGFTVYDDKGEVVFRVDSYGPDAHDSKLILMDSGGKCLLTVQRKMPSLHQRWEGFSGERTDGQKPIFSVRRTTITGRSSVTVEMSEKPGEEYEYKIQGSFSRRFFCCGTNVAQRCCTIFNGDKESVAEIKRKVDASTHVVLGEYVFSLSIKPGIDGVFAMGLVLILDQINGNDYVENGGNDTNPATAVNYNLGDN